MTMLPSEWDMIDMFPPLSQTGRNITKSNTRRPLQSMFSGQSDKKLKVAALASDWTYL